MYFKFIVFLGIVVIMYLYVHYNVCGKFNDFCSILFVINLVHSMYVLEVWSLVLYSVSAV